MPTIINDMKKICPYCKKEYETDRKEQVCCSKACAVHVRKPEDVGLFRPEIPDRVKKYIVGLITTDGCITGSKTKYIVISLKDEYMIKMIRDITCPTKKVYKDGDNYQVKWRNKKDFEILERLRILHRKSFITEFINLESNIWDYIRGIFDGDGCAYYSKNGKYKYLCISFSTASEHFAYGLNLFLNENGIHSIINKDCRNREMYYVKIYRKESVKLFRDKIYSNCDKWKLDRKYLMFSNL